jgi:4-hydroxy-2-oxoglutarate aldolase
MMTRNQIIAHLEGIFAPVVTPFTRLGRIDEGGFTENAARYAATGLSGILVSGTTGEAAYLAPEERLRLVDLCRPMIKPPQLLLVGTGLEGTAHTLRLSREAIARGADAVVVLPPAYLKAAMRPSVLAAHFQRVADGLRRPLLIYSIPQCTGFSMDAGMLGKLSGHPNIPGMKESSGNLDFDRSILDKARKSFRLLTGSALLVPSALEEGATGAVLSQANFVPQICVGIYEAFRTGNEKTVKELRRKLVTLFEKITLPYGIPGVKAAMELSGYCGGYPRLPLEPVNQAARKKIAEVLRTTWSGLSA